MQRDKTTETTANASTVRGDRADVRGGRFTRGEWVLIAVVALSFLHHVDHVLRAEDSGWPFNSELTPFTVSLVVYPIFLSDFLLLWKRPWVRVGVVALLFIVLLVVHAILEPPADQYATWADGVSSAPHAIGRPNLLEMAAPAVGVASVAVSTLLSLAVLLALVLLLGEARRAPRGQ